MERQVGKEKTYPDVRGGKKSIWFLCQDVGMFWCQAEDEILVHFSETKPFAIYMESESPIAFG